MKKVMYMYAGSKNHGCEALARTTAKLLGGPKDVTLWSFNRAEDEEYGVLNLVEKCVETEEIKRFSLGYFEALLRRKILKQSDANFDVFLKKTFKNSAAIAIGGDNYCYPWSAQKLIDWNKKIRKYSAFSVLWGCSIDAEVITPEMAEDLAGYDLIAARETITYERLKAINPHTELVSDPAFILETEKLPLPDGFIEGNTVGINVSPLIMDYGPKGRMIMANYEALISYILDNTDMAVCLIPHVVWKDTNDLEPINELYGKFSESGRICKVQDCNCMQLKGYISRCRFFVGARTHSTIAAYSSEVPTLVVGYSVKSRGIAKDLFGEGENYVLPVQGLTDENQLPTLFKKLVENEESLRAHLKEIMPEYKQRAYRAKKLFENLTKR